MKPKSIGERVQELENLADALGVEIKNEKIKGLHPRKGGLCKVKGKYTLFIDKKSTLTERFFLLLESMCLFDYDNIYLSPRMRELLDNKKYELLSKGKTVIKS